MLKISKNLIMLAIFSLSQIAFAGKDRGGGDSVTCNNGILSILYDEYHNPILSDLFGAAEIDFFESLELGNSEVDFESKILNFLEQNRPDDAREIRTGVQKLKFISVYKPLDSLHDGVDISAWNRWVVGCRDQQLAVQDFNTHTVYVYEPHHGFLSRFEKVMFKIHEARMVIESSKNIPYLQMEKQARAFVRSLFEDAQFRAAVIPPKLISPKSISRIHYYQCKGYLLEEKTGEKSVIDTNAAFTAIGFPTYGSDPQAIATMAETTHYRLVYDNHYQPGGEIHLVFSATHPTDTFDINFNIGSELYNRDGVPTIEVFNRSPFGENGVVESNVVCKPLETNSK